MLKTATRSAYAYPDAMHSQEARPLENCRGVRWLDTEPSASGSARSMRQKELSDFSVDGVACPTCGVDKFDCTSAMKQHHAMAHGESIAGVEVNCEQCGDTFTSFEVNDPNDFCSRECQGIANRDRVELVCEYCGDSFEVRSSRGYRRFCGLECAHRGQDQPTNRVELTCKNCGDSYERPESEVGSSTFCQASCQHEWRSKNRRGPNHPQWTGGVTIHRSVTHQLPHPWGTTRRGFLEDNDGKCELCGKAITTRKNVHHIIPVLAGGVNADELLMLLCSVCHQTVESYTRQFTERHLVKPLADGEEK